MQEVGAVDVGTLFVTKLSLSPELFFKSTQKYLASYVQDGRRLAGDFELLNELYVITMGDGFREKEQNGGDNPSQLIMLEVG